MHPKHPDKPWAHRVVSRKQPDGRTVLGIYAAYYNQEDLSAPFDVSENPVLADGLNIDDLKDSLIRIIHSTMLPVLKYEDYYKDVD
jgi:hypothetical protein